MRGHENPRSAPQNPGPLRRHAAARLPTDVRGLRGGREHCVLCRCVSPQRSSGRDVAHMLAAACRITIRATECQGTTAPHISLVRGCWPGKLKRQRRMPGPGTPGTSGAAAPLCHWWRPRLRPLLHGRAPPHRCATARICARTSSTPATVLCVACMPCFPTARRKAMHLRCRSLIAAATTFTGTRSSMHSA